MNKKTLAWYRDSVDLLRRERRRMRLPERNLVCDILADGALQPDPTGARYGRPEGETVACVQCGADFERRGSGKAWRSMCPACWTAKAMPMDEASLAAKRDRLERIRYLERLRSECLLCGMPSKELREGVCPDCDGRADEDGRAP